MLTIFYFLIILGICYLFLHYALDLIYLDTLVQPWDRIVQSIILILVVAVGLTFRQLMGYLSEMRYPNTYTSRTMFIVITTVLFHFLFYLIIPSTYLRFNEDLRGPVLNLISNQAITFIIVQIILAGFDLMYCCWNRRRKIVQD